MELVPGPDVEQMKFTFILKGPLSKPGVLAYMETFRELLLDISLKCLRKCTIVGFCRLIDNTIPLVVQT